MLPPPSPAAAQHQHLSHHLERVPAGRPGAAGARGLCRNEGKEDPHPAGNPGVIESCQQPAVAALLVCQQAIVTWLTQHPCCTPASDPQFRAIVPSQEKFARSIFFTLLKTCQNQILCQSAAHFEGKPAPWKLPKVRALPLPRGHGLRCTLQGVAAAASTQQKNG